MVLALAFWCCGLAPAHAANCYGAASRGTTGPADWQTYCWLDLTSFSDATARSTTGQALSFTLSDGSTLSFKIKITGPTLTAATTPSWGGAAVGNTAFLGIPGKPALYMAAPGTTTATLSEITLTPPPGNSTASSYMLVVGDAESSNGGESLDYVTNGGSWTELDRAGPISGSTYPTITGLGTTSVHQAGVDGSVGAFILGTSSPTTTTVTMSTGGLQGVMFAIRYASLSLDLAISGARADAADQFRYDIKTTASGTVLATNVSSGAGLGPFSAATLNASSALSLTLAQRMETGSVSPLANYLSTLRCYNTVTGATTGLPNGLATTSYDFGPLNFGDFITCSFTNTPHPHLKLVKALGAGGRQYGTDQFTLAIRSGGSAVATTTTTGTGSTLGNAATAMTKLTAGSTYNVSESASGTTSLDQYLAALSCSNANSASSTALPTAPGGSVTMQMGDVVTCTITNTKRAPNATLYISKSSTITADPVNGATLPKAIPGSTVRYSVTVWNTGPATTDMNTVLIVDTLPTTLSVGSAANPQFLEGSVPSTLAFTASDTAYSSASTPPASFAACTYTPTAQYDPLVRYICINPKGTMAGSTGTPPSFTVTFAARVN